MARKFGNTCRFNPFLPSPEMDQPEEPQASGAFKKTESHYHEAILAACDKVQAKIEFNAQHGAVKILMKDGKLV
jgi:hypothetical protein